VYLYGLHAVYMSPNKLDDLTTYVKSLVKSASLPKALHLVTTEHRVGRVLSFSQVVRIGTPPTPNPQVSVPPPLPVLGGGAHSLAREGLGKSQFRRGDIHCGTLYLYVLCATESKSNPLL
jgi:hypothetical protein